MVKISIPQAQVTILANKSFGGNITDAQQWIKQQIEKYIALGIIYIIPEWNGWYDGQWPTYIKNEDSTT